MACLIHNGTLQTSILATMRNIFDILQVQLWIRHASLYKKALLRPFKCRTIKYLRSAFSARMKYLRSALSATIKYLRSAFSARINVCIWTADSPHRTSPREKTPILRIFLSSYHTNIFTDIDHISHKSVLGFSILNLKNI